MTTKVQVLEDASQIDSEDMGPLYLMAVRFLIDNQDIIGKDTQAYQLSIVASRLVGEANFKDARNDLWTLFQIESNTGVRIEILKSLGKIAKEDAELISKIDAWLSSENTLRASGQPRDLQVIRQATISLGQIGNSSSFSVLFTTMSTGFSAAITQSARDSLYQIQGDFKELILQVIQKNSIYEKKEALTMAKDDEKLTEDQKAEIAEVGLIVGNSTSSVNVNEQKALRELRYEAVKILTSAKWSKASEAAIQHFDLTLLERTRGVGTLSAVLEAIACLGAMGTAEAAERLNLYLGLIHTLTEDGNPIDDQIVLASITNLGILGYRIAFDNLLYTNYLGYSNDIKKAAKDAIKTLKR
jgi:hypothetical protein